MLSKHVNYNHKEITKITELQRMSLQGRKKWYKKNAVNPKQVRKREEKRDKKQLAQIEHKYQIESFKPICINNQLNVMV